MTFNSANATTAVAYTIGGVKVEFPVKAYPSQISMMDKIIRSCHRAQNCLLESPTGSGKTLALLCGAIAWQKAETKKLYDEYYLKKDEFDRQCLETLQEPLQNVQQSLEEKGISKNEIETTVTKNEIESDDYEDDEENLFRPRKKIKIEWKVPDSIENIVMEEDPIIETTKMDTSSDAIISDGIDQKSAEPIQQSKVIFSELTYSNQAESKLADQLKDAPKPVRIPKIYFGTRTHKQIAQVIKELRKTVYSDVRTTILSSRSHSCIHDGNVFQKKKYTGTVTNKNELCAELLDPRSGVGCMYYQNQKQKNFLMDKVTPETEPSTIWDIEDLVNYGKQKAICPYFAARDLMMLANVVFCPYNYLTDPMIRASMNISLQGDVIILDEAHNIEDTCRESASLSIEENDLLDAADDFAEKAKGEESETMKILAHSLRSVSRWIHNNKDKVLNNDFNSGMLTMYGPHAIQTFTDYEFGPSNFVSLKAMYTRYCQIMAEQTNEETKFMFGTEPVKATTKTLIQSLLFILETLYNEHYTKDYQVAISKLFVNQSNESQLPDQFGFHNMRNKGNASSRWKYTLHFWCLNPAVVFDKFINEVRCVVLTSGTLSPLHSFQSELGAKFPITLEANHVIDSSQCWVGALGMGPNNICLEGKYASTNTYQFQDEVGEVILKICTITPCGILCFVSSYYLLEKLQTRWEETGMANKIRLHKEIVCEPRRGDRLQDVLRLFYNIIDETKKVGVGNGRTGALLMAVCRGKVSEGLDFSDHNARAVITIGIPYPSIKDSQVTLKKSYNDQNKHLKHLLGGGEWYQIQAYRALNQALGRCIRHRKDWGAILLIDSRFSNEFYRKDLSKWIRNKLRYHYSYNEMIFDLTGFMENRLRIDEESKCL